MRRLLSTVAFLAASGLVFAPQASAQQFGVHLNWADDVDLGIGARAMFDLGGLVSSSDDDPLANLKGVVSGDYFFWDCDPFDCTYFEINGNAIYPFELEDSDLQPYVGGGLNFASVDFEGSGDTDVGLNLLGGINFDLGGFAAFAEAKTEVGGGDQFVLTFGVLLGSSGD